MAKARGKHEQAFWLVEASIFLTQEEEHGESPGQA